MLNTHLSAASETVSFPVEFDYQVLEQTIPERFESMVKRYPKRPAIRDEAGSLNYSELNLAANRIAHRILKSQGASKEPVALLASHGRNVGMGTLGIMKAGKIDASLHPDNPPERIRHILKGSGIRLIVTDDSHFDQAKEAAEGLADVILIHQTDEGVSTSNPDLAISAEDPAWILHTSGTTGEPKDVVQSHRNMLHCVRWHTHKLEVTAEDRLSCLLPSSVIGGMREILLPLLNGACLQPKNLKTEGLAGFADWLIQQRITVCRFISSVFRSFARTLDGSESFPDLRFIYVGGEPLTRFDVELFQRHFPPTCQLVNIIGATETGIFRHFVIDSQTQLPGATIPVGYPVDDMTVSLLDAVGAPTPLGEVGEITIKSRYLALGYWNEPELTERVFTVDPDGSDERIYRTGDLGRFSTDGCLECLGRKDSQINVNGYRIELDEVEAALLEIELVREGVVATRDNGNGHVSLQGFVAWDNNNLPSANELKTALRRKLPTYMIPTTFTFVNKFPRKQNGKIDRKALLLLPLHLGAETFGFLAPRSRTEKRLAVLWQDCLGIKAIGIQDDFFELGGESLHAIQIIACVEKEFSRSLRPATLFEAPTVETFAAFLDRGETTRDFPSLFPVQRRGCATPFFWVHGDSIFATLPLILGPSQPIYGLDHQSQDGTPAQFKTVQSIARHYLRQIRAVRPHGPYLLGGFSFGGTLAFEIGLELIRCGEEVPLLFVLDSHFPGTGIPRPIKITAIKDADISFPRWCIRQFRKTLRRIYKDIGKDIEGIKNRMILFFGEQFNRPIPVSLRSFYVLDFYVKALKEYEPQTFQGDLIYVKSSDRNEFHQQSWRKVVNGQFNLYEFPGVHVDMKSESNVRRWGPILKQYLEERR